MIVISSAVTLAAADALGAWLPVIGWHNLVTAENIVASSADAEYPVTNLANPNTVLRWESDSTAEQYLTVTLTTDEAVDYLALARHNFGSGQIMCSVEGLSADDGATWQTLVDDTFVPDDGALLFRFEPSYLVGIRLKLTPSGTVPRAAVLYAGKLLVCQRSVQVGHTPITLGRRRSVVNNRSEDGEFLGRVQTGEGLTTSASLQNFDPDWFRENFGPFLEEAPPFFFAWHPLYYPREVGFAWLTADATPSISHLRGYISIDMQMDAIA
jgi:hypothetical protein